MTGATLKGGPAPSLQPRTRAWFEAVRGPTTPRRPPVAAIAEGGHVLIQAPTGSGKTLAAFLYGIDRLDATPAPACALYISPLKALNYDVERNLRGPLAGSSLSSASASAPGTRRSRSAASSSRSRPTS